MSVSHSGEKAGSATFCKRRRFAVAAVILIAFMAWWAYWLSLPPRPLPSDAPPEKFSAERALEHIKVMARETHPSGSKANEKVFAYICEQLDAMDIEYVVYTPLLAGSRSLTFTRAIMARIRGTANTKAFAIDAHFDSTPYGPGAADDVAGCAAMLETARILKAGPPLMNDVILCFTDMEEEGTIGAWAVTQHPWFEDIGVMLGLEALGTSGPVLMFETSQKNGWLIRELARAGVSPRASSAMFEVFDALPLGTNFTTRYKRLVPGYNLAFINGLFHYHTILDNPENVSLASVQHMGDHTLGLARHLGNMPLYDVEAPNATYFNTLGSHLVVYPQSYGPLLAGLTLLFFLCSLAWARHRNYITLRQLFAALLVMLGLAIAVGILLGLAAFGVFVQFRENALYRNNWYCLGGCAVAFALYLGAVSGLRKRLPPQHFMAAGLVIFAVALPYLERAWPGWSYVATVSLLCGSLALWTLATCHASGKREPIALLLAAVFAVPALVILFPPLVIMASAITLLGMPVLAALFILLSSLAVTQIIIAIEGRSLQVLGTLAALGLLIFTAAFATNFPSPESPKPNSLVYGMDFDQGKAWWISTDAELDAYTSQFFGENPVRARIDEFYEGMQEEYFKAPAPFDHRGPTRLEVLDDVAEGDRRKLKLFLNSPRDAQRLALTIEDVQVFGARMLDHDFAGGEDGWTVNIRFLPHEGQTLWLEVEPGKNLRIHVREETYKLPNFVPERPDWMMPEPNRTLDHRRRPRSEHTFAVKTHDFGVGPQSRD